MVRTVEQQGTTRKASVHVGVRLNEDDQNKLVAIIEAGLADNVSDAVRCALFFGERVALRVLRNKKRSDA